MPTKKNRVGIPPDVAARVLFLSDRTCCVCRIKGKPVQIHHIDDCPSHNEERNLSVLCFDCHRETQIRGGFDRKLDAEQVILYRNDWVRAVAASRATSEASREVNDSGSSLDVELVTSIAEIYRENKQYELLAIHYNAIGNSELRDKYVDMALQQHPSDQAIFFLRGTIQKRPELIPREVVDRHLSSYVGREDAEQYARALIEVGRRLDSAVEYIRGINDSMQRGNWFSAAFYLREFVEESLIDELLMAAYRKATEEGNLWWRVRALQELDWQTELRNLLLEEKDAINATGDVMLQQLLAEAQGNVEEARSLRKEIAKGTQMFLAPETDEPSDDTN